MIIKVKCIYCAKIFASEPKKHVTFSLWDHILNCLQNFHPKDVRQSLLSFQPVVNPSATKCECNEGVLSIWMFNKEAIRRALT